MASPLAAALAYQGSVPTPTTQVQPTDVTGAYKNFQDMQEKNYQTDMAQRNALFGGLAGLGGAALMGPLGGLGGLFGGTNPVVPGADYIAGGGAGDRLIPTFR